MFALQLQNVYLKIRKHQILKDISFSIPPKKICVFIGENGAGKSSTIRCILGLQKITYGTGSIFGKSIFNYQSRQNVSFVPDIEQFIDISVRQWILEQNKYFNLPVLTIYKRLNVLMKDAGLSKEILSRNIVSLSSGLKKIIMVVSALISQRKLVIMDEPTEYLDPIMKKNFFNLMQKHKCKGITFFVSTHNLLEIDKYVDYLVVIKNGEIALSKYWNKHKINLQKAYEKFYESNDTSNFD